MLSFFVVDACDASHATGALLDSGTEARGLRRGLTVSLFR